MGGARVSVWLLESSLRRAGWRPTGRPGSSLPLNLLPLVVCRKQNSVSNIVKV